MIMETKNTRLAGVTFNNDPVDGGESRQALLKAIYDRRYPVRVMLFPCIYHNPSTGLDEDAIKVRLLDSMRVVGWIPRDDIKMCKDKNYKEMLLIVSEYKGTYSGGLYEIIPPTARQYGVVKSLKAKHKIKSYPDYDKRCYDRCIQENC